jgi:drug/metabolite transporter (DMT)-like permease
MSRRDIVLIAVLSLIWGASFMFIRVADRQFDPFALVFFRVLLGCAVLVPAALATAGRRGLAQARAAWWKLVLLGLINTAAPFLLFSWAETRITSSLAGILQAAAPICTAILAIRFGHERVVGMRLAGVLLGVVGVALLLGSPGGGGLLAALAVVLAAFFYAAGGVFAGAVLSGVDPMVNGAGGCLAAAVIAAPFGLTRLPPELPGWKELGSILALGLVGTGVAYMILFALVRSAGPSRAILVTYMIPGIAVLYGWLLLGEGLRALELGGLALILAGVALAGRGRRPAPDRPYTAPLPSLD